MKLKLIQPVNINGAWIEGDQDIPGRLASTLIARGWAIDLDKEVVEKVEAPEKRVPETAVKRPAKPIKKKSGGK